MDRRDDDTVRRTVDTIKGDTHDVLDEGKERVKAGAEKAKRAVEGDYDKTKRDVRDEGV
ncbi:MAG: hypothetical protein JWM87_300 [Candidatus Eremiobacteraeota bacterium]|nr:hypothetical protein [Candidatus Eremiobacteraeota bacterium]